MFSNYFPYEQETVISVDDILKWEFLWGNKGNIISTYDYPIDIMLLADHTPESQSRQVVPEKASVARVKYDYIFEKVLSATDTSQRITIPIAEAEKHFPWIIDKKGVVVQVYDINCEKRIELRLVRNYRMYYLAANWKEYVKKNQLQEGDSVLFYKTGIDHSEYIEVPPYYALQIRRSGKRVDTGFVYISLDKLMNSKKSGSSEVVGNEDMQISTCAVNVESSREVIPEGEASVVKYDYLFEKILTDTDVRSYSIRVLTAEAKEHFSFIQATDKPIDLRVYDNNRCETMEWKFSWKKNCHISKTMKYLRGNYLNAGDSILFYKTTSDQIVISEPPPRYAVQFEKTRETIDTRSLYIPLDEMVTAELFASELGKFLV